MPPTRGSGPTADPLAGVERVFIDGTNLLYALARESGRRPIGSRGGDGSGAGAGERGGGSPGVGPSSLGPPGAGPPGAGPPGAGPPGAVVARIRAAFPPGVVIDLVFDGPPVGGLRGRLASGLRVSYSGRSTADSVIDAGVAAQLRADGPAATWGILVVSDDRGLRELVGAKGARTAGASWLAGRIAGSHDGRRGGPPGPPAPKAGTTIGHRRPPRPPCDRRAARDR